MRLVTGTTILLALVLLVAATPAFTKNKTYQTGTLLDQTFEDTSQSASVRVSSGTAVVGSPIPGRTYTFRIRVEDLVYVAEYKAGKRSYLPECIVNDPIELRVQKDRMFLKRPDGKEVEVEVVKKERQN